MTGVCFCEMQRVTLGVQLLELLMKSLGSSPKPRAPAPARLEVRNEEEKTFFHGSSFSRKRRKGRVPAGRVAGGHSLLGEPGLGVGIRPVANKSQVPGTKGLPERGESTRGRGSLCLPPAPALPLLPPPGAAEGARRARFGLATTPRSLAPCTPLVAAVCQSSDLPAAPRCQRTPGLATGAGSGSRLVESTSSCLRAAMRGGSCQPWSRAPRSSSNPR